MSMRNLVSNQVNNIAKLMGADVYRDYGGLLITPRGYGRATLAFNHGSVWAMDNDCFNVFNVEKILAMYMRNQNIPNCLFAVAPDVVADAQQTLIRFAWWEPVIKRFGYPVAFVLQDGQGHYRIPWTLIDAIFIGGTTEFKLSHYVAGIVAEAKTRKKWVHMGRVNSHRRIKYAAAIGCDSFDGTGYTRFSNKYILPAIPYQINKQQRLIA